MKIRAMKVNVGMTFTIMDGDTPTKHTKHDANRDKLVRKAIDMWAEEVLSVLKQHEMNTKRFLDAVCDARHSPNGAVIQLEPVGFAWGTFENPEMGNSGSTPTEGRARMLLAYQSPLQMVKSTDGEELLIRDYEVT